jgi:hypothetical protein
MLVSTTKGELDDSMLELRQGNIDNTVECTDWTEYWLDGELVHRSVHIRLKTSPTLLAEAASIG